jgi:DNA primase
MLVEGTFDVLAVAAAADTAEPDTALRAVTPSGTALTRAQADIINRTVGLQHPIVVAFDADPAGRRAAARAWTVLGADLPPASDATRRDIRWLDMPVGHDPSELLGDRGAAGLQRLLADPANRQPLVDLVLDDRMTPWADRLDDIEARVAAALLSDILGGGLQDRRRHLW